MDQQAILKAADELALKIHTREGSGHDYWHVKRVEGLSAKIALQEKACTFTIRLAACLHDLDDYKTGGDEENLPQAKEFLEHQGFSEDKTQNILDIIRSVSFRGAGVNDKTNSIEAAILQDADRLDATGAIGVARTFAFGGNKNRPIYDPAVKPVCHTSYGAYKNSTAPTINHFYEKLLLLKDRMNTETARRMAEERHRFMEDFLVQFYAEWQEATENKSIKSNSK